MKKCMKAIGYDGGMCGDRFWIFGYENKVGKD
jgi:hypothetical protein